MKMRIARFAVLLVFISYFSESESFVFKYKEGDKYRYLTEVFEKVYYNEIYNHSAEILNKIAVSVDQVKGSKGYITGTFQVSQRITGEGTYELQDEEAVSRFWRDAKGNCEIPKRTLYPLSRNIPYFPKVEIKKGGKWEAPGEEIHDFAPYGYREPIHVPVKVKYEYVGNEEKGEKDVAMINLSYSIYKEAKELSNLDTIHPVNIIGKVEQTLYWDIEAGRVDSYEDTFHIVYTFNNGEVVDFIGTSNGISMESEDMNKKKIEEEIKKSLHEENIEDTTVKADENGVTITLEDIHFEAESDMLVKEEQEKLEKIGGILKRYAERDLFIAGHTALAGTEKGRQELSEKRAKSVADFLLMLGVRKENQLTYKGFGGRFPVADNTTEEGMKKNRRVEIRILEN